MSHTSLRMPAEWEKHRATWIAWPHEQSDWPQKFEPIPWVYAEIVRVLAHSELVEVLCASSLVQESARRHLQLTRVPESRYRLHLVDNDRSWLRDSGPTAVWNERGDVNLVQWSFNAWAKYNEFSKDALVAKAIANLTKLPLIQAESLTRNPVVLEGGAIETDGQGTLMVTEECLLSTTQERNPGLGRSDYEAVFARYLGISKTIWLPSGVSGDDTHGHIDDLARFVQPGKVVVVVESDPSAPDYEATQANLSCLKQAKDAQDRSLEVITLPMPRKIVFGEEVLPASYANFYIANEIVLVPTFNDPADRVALNILAECFPTRQVVGICAVDLILGQGTLHCLTQQEPQARTYS